MRLPLGAASVAALLVCMVAVSSPVQAQAAPARSPQQPSTASASASGRRTSVAAVVLPCRGEDTVAMESLANRVAVSLARRLRGTSESRIKPESLDVSLALRRGQHLAESGRLDESASVLDSALEDGAERPYLVNDPAGFITAHLTRAMIAIARGEHSRAERLLERALSYEPALSLQPTENTPSLHAALERVRGRLESPSELEAAHTGTACDLADVVVVIRLLEVDDDRRRSTLELVRFDGGQPVAQVRGSLTSNAEELARLLADPSSADARARQPARSARLGLAESGSAAEQRSSRDRRRWWLGALAGAGLAVAGVGGGLAYSVDDDYQRLRDSCGVTQSCPPSSYEGLRRREMLGYGLATVGGLVAAGTMTWWLVSPSSSRSRSPHDRSGQVWLQVLPNALVLGGEL
ncbi:MAG: hypothetical protein V2A73_00835 [Pseudomonadota bacterium]